jgi:hypothetical protein
VPARAKLSLQPLMSIVCLTNAIVCPPSRPADRKSVGEVGDGLKRFLFRAWRVAGCASACVRPQWILVV